MSESKFKFAANINTDDPRGIEPVLADLIGVDGILRTDYGFRVRSTMQGRDAIELNRKLLSSLRRVELGTTLQSEWTHDGTTERFIDYEPNGSGLTAHSTGQ